jgi:excisionase family DNA binding protein
MSIPRPPRQDTVFLTVKQLASRWQMSERHVRRILANGDLAMTQLGRAIRIPLQAVVVYEAAHSGPFRAPPVI